MANSAVSFPFYTHTKKDQILTASVRRRQWPEAACAQALTGPAIRITEINLDGQISV